MKEYTVIVPVVMEITVGVKANSEDEAKKKALSSPAQTTIKLEGSEYDEYDISDYTFVDHTWEPHTKIVQGNVYYGGINEIQVVSEEEIEEDDENKQ